MTATPPPGDPNVPPQQPQYQQPQYQAAPVQPAPPFTPAEDISRAALAYQLAWLGWAAFIGPLIIWLTGKDRGPRVANEGKEALNFGITVSAIVVVWNIVFGSIAAANTPFSMFGYSTGNAALFWIFGLLNWIVIIGVVVVAAIWSFKGAGVVKAGGAYRYPFAIRLIK
ncbi:MAG: DUF4870 domain-containing protein [Microbacteriaceae bacterium]|nr:DUF4870 domain-containing protein [Microbacteriaceae bacterium]